jgi:hypothetical protein
MDQIALVDVLPALQPRPPQTTPVQDVSEGALDEFRRLRIACFPTSERSRTRLL